MIVEGSGEQVGQQLIQIEGPEQLAEGQNIYDQRPFNRFIYGVFQESGIPESGLRIMLSAVAENLANKFGSTNIPSPQELDKELLLFTANIGTRDRFRDVRRIALNQAGFSDAKPWDDAVKKITRSLARYPFWYSYISQSRAASRFSPSGEKIREVNQGAQELLELPKGYGAWLEHKIQTDTLLTALTVDVIFEEAADPQRNRTGGRRGGWRKWTFKKNDNLRVETKPSPLAPDIDAPPSFSPPQTRPKTE